MRDNATASPCPACGARSNFLTAWPFSGLNVSIFDYTASFFDCPQCGMSFIANISDDVLKGFYETECCYFESAHFDISAPENLQKYRYYRDILVRAGLSDTPVIDVGCGRGGFLLWLTGNGWQGDCIGVDIDLKSIPATPAESGRKRVVAFQEGRAVDLPFQAATRSLLCYFHVLEHIRGVDAVLEEAARVLEDGGHIMIEVPDAERYGDFPIGTAFWIGIREHVNHFSPKAVCVALQRQGFEVVSVERAMVPTPEFSYPSLVVLARKGGSGGTEFRSSGEIASFITGSQQGLKNQAGTVRAIAAEHGAITFWGCSAELFSLLPLIGDLRFSICDSSGIKQQCRYRKSRIMGPSEVPKEGALVIAPYLHGDAIEKAALELGWPEGAIYRLR